MAPPPIPLKTEEKKAPSMQDEGMKEFLTQLVTSVVMALKQAETAARTDTLEALQEREAAVLRAREMCPVCQQVRAGCGNVRMKQTDANGEVTYVEQEPGAHHVLRVVYPADPEKGKWFMGCRINGKVYLSGAPSHRIWIPKVAEGTIARMVYDFEDQESFLSRRRSGGQKLGVIGPDFAQTRGPQTANEFGWS